MEPNFTVIEQAAGKDNSVQVLQYNTLDGSDDFATARTLFYAKQVGMHLKQVKILLNNGSVVLEAGALHFMKGNISSEAKAGGLSGLAKKLASSMLTNETTFKPQYQGTGEIYLEPTFGHFAVIQLNNEEVITERGMFCASEASIEVGVAMQKNISSALLGGEGFFQTKLSGTGWCVLVSPVPSSEIVRYQLNNEKLSVDGNFVLLRKGNIDFRVEKSSKSVLSSMRSGEGLLQTFSGTGEVWLAPTQSIYERIRLWGIEEPAQVKGSSGQNTTNNNPPK